MVLQSSRRCCYMTPHVYYPTMRRLMMKSSTRRPVVMLVDQATSGHTTSSLHPNAFIHATILYSWSHHMLLVDFRPSILDVGCLLICRTSGIPSPGCPAGTLVGSSAIGRCSGNGSRAVDMSAFIPNVSNCDLTYVADTPSNGALFTCG